MARIAVLVHTPIVNDGRVRKIISTLNSLGHEVSAFGFDMHHLTTEGKRSLEMAQIASTCKLNITFLPFDIKTLKATLPVAALFVTSLALLVGIWLVVRFGISLSSFTLWTIVAFLVIGASLVFSLRRFFFEFLVAIMLRQRMGNQHFDLLYCNDVPGLMTGVLFTGCNQRLIWDAHEAYADVAYVHQIYRLALNKFLSFATNKIKGFVTISESMGQLYTSRFKNLPRPVIVMNASPRTDFGADDERLRQASKISKGKMICLFQGVLQKDRGIEESLEAARMTDDRWVFVFMGNGPLRGEIEKHQANFANIRIIPPAPFSELEKWTCGADLGLLLYRPASLNFELAAPNKLWEYPNALVPYLATDLQEPKRFLELYGCGMLLERSFTSHDLADKLNSIKEQDLLNMRENCAIFRQQEHWEKYSKRLIQLVEDTLSDG